MLDGFSVPELRIPLGQQGAHRFSGKKKNSQVYLGVAGWLAIGVQAVISGCSGEAPVLLPSSSIPNPLGWPPKLSNLCFSEENTHAQDSVSRAAALKEELCSPRLCTNYFGWFIGITCPRGSQS